MAFPSTHLSLLCDMNQGGRREEAWAVFQSRYRGVIQGWCLRRGLTQDEAEDLTQEILLRLCRQLPRYAYDAARGSFRSWLQTVVSNAITDRWRRQRRHLEGRGVGGSAFLERLATLETPEAADELSGLVEDHARNTASEILEHVRAKVKDTTWQAFFQMMVEHRPAGQVADELGLNIATVYKANYRVKQMLLEEYRHVDPLR